MWSAEGYPDRYLSTYYDEHVRNKRPPMYLQLPCGTFVIDMVEMNDGKPHPQRKGWTVTGNPPNVTLSPSVDVKGAHGWHGFITNGEISDDLGGRKY